MLEAGVKCSISSDDPVLMGTDLTRECAAAADLGHTPRGMYEHALSGVFCDAATAERLARAGTGFDWDSAEKVT
jgi:aminodeoxyfutalosine deaminase